MATSRPDTTAQPRRARPPKRGHSRNRQASPADTPATLTATLGPQTALQDAIHEPHNTTRARIISALRDSPLASLQRQAASMRTCGVTGGLQTRSASQTVHPWISRCKARLCPFCAQARAAHVARQLHTIINGMPRPIAIVLTLKHRDAPLASQIHTLRAAFRRLRKTPLWRARVSHGAYVIEVTHNPETRRWHPHLHIIANSTYIPQSSLRSAWHHATGDSEIVHISRVHNKAAAAWDVAKYSGKPAKIDQLDAPALREYAAAVHSQRIMQSFGRRPAAALHDRDTDALDERRTGSAPLGRLIALANRGYPVPQRLLQLAAARWPSVGRYVAHEMPLLAPPARATARACDALDMVLCRGGPERPHLPANTYTKRLDAALWRTMHEHLRNERSGAYNADQPTQSPRPRTLADASPSYRSSMDIDRRRTH